MFATNKQAVTCFNLATQILYRAAYITPQTSATSSDIFWSGGFWLVLDPGLAAEQLALWVPKFLSSGIPFGFPGAKVPKVCLRPYDRYPRHYGFSSLSRTFREFFSFSAILSNTEPTASTPFLSLLPFLSNTVANHSSISFSTS